MNMKNVTISMDDELHRLTRIEAAKSGKSMSRYLADIARERIDAESAEAQVKRRNLQKEALEKILAGPGWNVMRDGRMPNADERNER